MILIFNSLDLIRYSTSSEQFVCFTFNQGHHYGAHSHSIEDADSADNENEWRKDEWVEHHSPDVVVSKVCQEHVHEHWRASTSHVMLDVNNKLEMQNFRMYLRAF